MADIKKRKRVYKGKGFKVERLTIKIEDSVVKRDVIERGDGVVIIPIDEGGRVALISEYCAGSNSMVLSLPGGSIDKGETPEIAAARELREEIGMAPKQLIPLSAAFWHPSLSSRKSYAFIALGLEEKPLPASGEIIKLAWQDSIVDAIETVSQPFVSDVSTSGYLAQANQRLRP